MDALIDQLIHEEGVVPWPYLDTKRYVTAGVGHRIPSLAAMLQLPWHIAGMLASPLEITNVWNWLLAQTPGKVASYYKRELSLPDAAIRTLLQEDLDSTRKRIKGCYKGFDLYPQNAQRALLDMAFNLGVAGLLMKFPQLHFAAEAGNWPECAAQCARRDVSELRNKATAALFLQGSNPPTEVLA